MPVVRPLGTRGGEGGSAGIAQKIKEEPGPWTYNPGSAVPLRNAACRTGKRREETSLALGCLRGKAT